MAAATDWPQIVGLYAQLVRLAPTPVVELLPATRADLLRRLGRHAEAAAACHRALELCGTDAEHRYLRRRLREVSAPTS